MNRFWLALWLVTIHMSSGVACADGGQFSQPKLHTWDCKSISWDDSEIASANIVHTNSRGHYAPRPTPPTVVDLVGDQKAFSWYFDERLHAVVVYVETEALDRLRESLIRSLGSPATQFEITVRKADGPRETKRPASWVACEGTEPIAIQLEYDVADSIAPMPSFLSLPESKYGLLQITRHERAR